MFCRQVWGFSALKPYMSFTETEPGRGWFEGSTMSTRDDGHGRKAGPNPGLQSDFASTASVGKAPSAQTWGNNALKAQPSEVKPMAHGGGRPGQPATGQRPMFGGSSPMFAQMPSYTPVTRGNEQDQPAPQPTQPSFSPYAPSPPAPSQAPLNYQSSYSQAPTQPSYPASVPSYQSPQPAAARSGARYRR